MKINDITHKKSRSGFLRKGGIISEKPNHNSGHAQPAEPRVVKAGFNARVYSAVAQVPYGRVATYGDIATIVGSPRVARHVGFALSALDKDDVPWHRIINAQGRISGKGDTIRATLQRQFLENEGIEFDERDRVFEFHRLRWRGP